MAPGRRRAVPVVGGAGLVADPLLWESVAPWRVYCAVSRRGMFFYSGQSARRCRQILVVSRVVRRSIESFTAQLSAPIVRIIGAPAPITQRIATLAGDP